MSNKHALIIDDDRKNVSVLTQLLEKENVSSTQVLDSSQLDAAIHNIKPVDVIFIDLEMPEKDGYDVLQQLKGDARFQSAPMVAYTVHVSEVQVAHQHGFDGFIGKPLDSDKFPDQLARILSGKGVWETV